jgi:PAP2 superfamily
MYFVVGGKAITYSGRLFNLLRLGMRRDRAAIVCGMAFFAVVLLAASVSGRQSSAFSSIAMNLMLIAVGLFVIVAPYMLRRLAKVRPESPLKFLGTDRSLQLHAARLVVALPFLFMVSLFLPAFSLAKSNVGQFFAYDWDQAFVAMDIAIHGTDAWRFVHPLIGYAPVTYAINMAYQIWIFLLYIAVPFLWIIRMPKSLRKQFGLSYILCWILIGALFANIFASVGPCFLEPMTGDNHFRPLLEYLSKTDRQFPLLALDVQQKLLEWRAKDNGNLGGGISAMPSMHVSIALLVFLGMRRIGRVFGWVFGTFFVVILLGSVHTGYHYAVDGYASIILTLLIWLGVGRLSTVNASPSQNKVQYQPMPTS